MPNLPPISLPADAAEKAAETAKDRDYYADLTDEERAEEDLPPRETAKPDTEAEKEAEQEKPGPGDDEDEDEDEEYDRKLYEEITGLRADINASLGTPETAKVEAKAKDPLIDAALEHDDEVVRGLAERLQRAEQRLEAREAEAKTARTEVQLARDDADFDAVQAAYMIDGKPMTDAHVEQVEQFILKNPGAASLSIEQLTRAAFPNATKRVRSASAKGPANQNGDGPAVATIVDQGAGSGGTTSEPWKPRPNETIESAIQAAGRRFNWKR